MDTDMSKEEERSKLRAQIHALVDEALDSSASYDFRMETPVRQLRPDEYKEPYSGFRELTHTGEVILTLSWWRET